MRSGELKVTFQPTGRTVYVLEGTSLLEAAGRAGIILQTPCGGRGTCGKCRVRVVDGTCSPATSCGDSLSEDETDQGYRLACQCTVGSNLVVEIPDESTFERRARILTGDSGEEAAALKPVVAKRFFQLDPPSTEDPRADLTRLLDAVSQSAIRQTALVALPGFLRQHQWSGTAVTAGGAVLALEPGDTTSRLYGLALDVGTTTVVGTLFDLTTGREAGVASHMNGQIAYGDDVVARIQRVREDAGALRNLQDAIVQTINDVIAQLVAKTGIAANHIHELVVAGNSTMQQILCGYDPAALGEVPFVQVFENSHTLDTIPLGLRVHPSARLMVFPQIGGFVGGDTLAGMIASRLDKWDAPVALVDIGTNGEIVLVHNDTILAASTAAGPAFEGARIKQGMRAAEGAIEKVLIRDDVRFNVIGNATPVGLCGTAVIDAAAELLRLGIVDETGRILSRDEAPPDLPAQILDRLVEEDGEMRFALVQGVNSSAGRAISLWQRDVRELQLASGAIRAGLNLLLRRAGLEPDDLGTVLLAGAFGNFIRRKNARRIGLLPQIPRERIRFIGNAASLGAKLALLSADERAYADELTRKAEHVDLSLDPEFQMEFATSMIFPDGDVAD